MRKGFAEAPENMIEWVGLILICIIMLYVIVSWAGAGAQVQTSLEQGSLIWSIASATNALSVMEEGEVVRNLRSYFDIEVTCSHACEVATAAYDRSNNRMPKSDEVLILGKIRPVVMEMVNKISLTKEPQQEVVLSGEQVENLFGTELQIREESPMCFSQTAKFKDLIQQASSKYGIEKELIAAVIMAESSWNPASERYEPGFQTRYLEGKGFETSQYWISRSDPGALTIREWFSQNPGREDEMGSLNDYELNLIAQTRMSSSYGLMQTMYLTAYQSCGYRGEPEGLNDPGESIDCGTRYLKSRMDMYGSLADAVSAYNAGSALWRTNGPNKQYTEKVLGLYNAFRACPE